MFSCRHNAKPFAGAVLGSLLLAFVPLPRAKAQEGAWFHSLTAKYSLYLPGHWTAMPKDTLEEWRQRAATGGGGDFAFDAGWELRDANGLPTGVCIVVAVLSYSRHGLPGPPGIRDMRGIASALTGKNGGSVRDANAASRPGGCTVEPATLDANMAKYSVTLSSAGEDGPPMRSRIVGRFGGQSLVQTVFSCPAGQWRLYEPVFDQIESSFRFDPGWGYKDGPKPPAWRSTLKWASVTGAILAAIFVLYRQKKARLDAL